MFRTGLFLLTLFVWTTYSGRYGIICESFPSSKFDQFEPFLAACTFTPKVRYPDDVS